MHDELELVFHPQVQAIFDHFCALHDIRIAFYSPAGVELRVGKSRPNCGYCRLLRNQLGYEDLCLRLDRKKRQEAERCEDGMIVYECHGGMTEALMPVRAGGRLLGFVMIGQFRTQSCPPAAMVRKAGSRVLKDRVRKAYERTPRFPASQLRHIVGMFELLVRFIAEHHLIELKDMIGPVLARLRERPEEHLSLSQAAAMVGRSPTTLSHRFRRTLGKSYQQVRTESILDKADAYLRSSPGIRVREVALKLGFDDPLYFSRLYKKHRGVPPGRRRLKHS